MEEKERWSASKISLYEDCDFAFWCRYKLKIPDLGNDGQKRGNVCHTVLECLLNRREKRRKYFDQIIEEKTIENCEPVWRLLNARAKKEGLKSEADIDLINKMIVTGLKNDFYCEGSEQLFVEKEFRFEEENFSMIGFMDKVAVYKNHIKVKDYKSSKMKFDQKKINDNDQAFVYRIAIFKEYNIIPDVEFIFLKFPNSPIQVAPRVTPESLNGYIKYVNFIAGESKKMNEENSQLRLAACDPKKRWKCGKAQTPEEEARGVWCCAYKFPKKYYSVIDKDGKIVYSSFDPIPDSKLVSFAGGKVVQKEYAGCPAFKVSDDYSIF